jgi:hypothetical protein
MPVTGNRRKKQFWNNVPTGKIVLHVDAEPWSFEKESTM